MSADWSNITERLEGCVVVLEPLAPVHEAPLWEAANYAEIWTWLDSRMPGDRERFGEWFQQALSAAKRGEEAAFATLDAGDGTPIGSTRYLALRPQHRGLEIGWTWLTPAAWRSGANIEAKLLMLEHAFERLNCVRVEFKTDSRNERSRAALAALPAELEGVFRNHRIMPGVGLWHSAFYSVVDDEWPEVEKNLRRRLEAVHAQAGI